MMTIRKSCPADGPRVVEIWCRSVDATHGFLSPQDRRDIEREVRGFLPDAPLDLAIDGDDRPVGFMLLDGGHMEALFIDPDHRGRGVGRQLVAEALKREPDLSTDVNEQNLQAVGFYRRMGFEPVGRSARDGQGRPYPLIHLRHTGSS
ncbi:acetyltransferase [Stappia taiwanensis]|uniref:Acetyltransferase n=1 Tax=Stappia taiwanensis TaxID=992267 RepID=A0A838XY65_9HYPH|nr:acetyltransferase [Stappia taiwanensis]MBA4611974.1 acetyltransferase [Stappia taiwanensis]